MRCSLALTVPCSVAWAHRRVAPGSATRQALRRGDDDAAGNRLTKSPRNRGVAERGRFQLSLYRAGQRVPAGLQHGQRLVGLLVHPVPGTAAFDRLGCGLQRGRAELADAGVELLVAVTQLVDALPGQRGVGV